MKASTFMVMPTVPLRQLPDRDRDTLRTFFTQHVRGVDAKHDKRWRRFIRDLFAAEPGEGFQLYRVEQRGGPYHRMHRVFLQRLFDSQERFRKVDDLHDWLKVGANFVVWGEGRNGNPVPQPRSTAYDVCSEDEIREAHAAMVEFLHLARSQRVLWPHIKPAMRAAALEAAIGDRPEDA